MTKDTTFHSLKILSRVQETRDAVTLYFDVPPALRKTSTYKAGQYLNLRFIIDGTDFRRAYSLCTSPNEGKWGVTIKLVDTGVVSSYILQHCREGDLVDIMPPEGMFTLTADPTRRRVYYFFAAGSGITPLMSQIRLLLEEEPMSSIHLYYGNRDQDSIIFKSWLDEAEKHYSGQFTVDHILSKPQSSGFLGNLLKKQKPLWLGEKGRIDARKIAEFLERYPKHHLPATYHICGPGDMIVTVRDALLSLGATKEEIHTEYFTPASSAEISSEGPPAGTYSLVAHLRGQRIETEIKELTILETLEQAGYDPPYSCTSGTCATCMAKIISGKVRMDQCFALSDQEVADGYVLTCQSHPVDGDVEVTYDY
jgi:ring-1,2-phenylacetyl-CoA epoxidase subunit PaaE